ncbi:MAG: aspartate--ammonia ligase [Acidobacteria bacterium]|nr:aspartate--ammonia ligase [Acidobacteriota bacterium]
MARLILPEGYRPALGLWQTEKAIKAIKDFFQVNLATELNLTRVTAPLFVPRGTGINDDLNGVERPVCFRVKDLGEMEAEIVHSLAKWKRLALADYGFEPGFGIYTDMNAIRADEELDNLHSLYVDQWDWERVITAGDRNLDFLRQIVRKIYAVIKRLEFYVHDHYPEIPLQLPEDIAFVHAEDLRALYPGLAPKAREDRAARECGALFIIGIGAPLADGRPHDGRAPDYDDWSTETEGGRRGLNGDILLWNPVLGCAFEISSMGIRVDTAALVRQLALAGAESRRELLFHRRLLGGELPLSIGGGIGQSRLCMYFLRKAHIGEIQVGLWPPDMAGRCRAHNIPLL